MGGAVLGPGVGLDLHDPAGTSSAGCLAHEDGPQQPASRRDDGLPDEVPEVGVAAQPYGSRRSAGMIQPNSAKKSGISDVRNSSAIWEGL